MTPHPIPPHVGGGEGGSDCSPDAQGSPFFASGRSGAYTGQAGVVGDGHGLQPSARRAEIPEEPETNGVFDPQFIEELEGIVVGSGSAVSQRGQGLEVDPGLRRALETFETEPEGAAVLTEEDLASLPPRRLAARCNRLIEGCRRSPRPEAARAVESFVVFFQTLLPTLGEEPAREVKATFHRLGPTLLQMAWEDFKDRGRREEGQRALRQLEALLLEVASVRLAPAESRLFYRSLDRLATLVSAGEYALAKDLVAKPLLDILRRNRVSRALFRLMEVEVAIQKYLKARLGYLTPQVRLPEDVPALSDFGPLHVFEEEDVEGRLRRYLQIQLPDIPTLSDVVVHLAQDGGPVQRDLRLDGLGAAELDLPPGLYRIGLAYAPGSEGGG